MMEDRKCISSRLAEMTSLEKSRRERKAGGMTEGREGIRGKREGGR